MANKSRLLFLVQSSSTDGANVDYYVSQAGSDSNPGTKAAPFATVEHAEGLIPPILNNSQYRIHLTSGSHLLPERGSFLRSRLLQNGSRIEVFADDDWDPAAVTVIATGTADAGTSASVVKASALTDDQYQDYTIEIMTVGGVPVPLALRERRHIRNNTATDINPIDGFFNAPTTGDAYRILQINCELKAPTVATGAGMYMLVEDCPCAEMPAFAAASYLFGLPQGSISPAGIALRGLNLRNSASFTSFAFGRTQVFAYGLERPVDDAPFTNLPNLVGTQMFGGVGLAAYKHLTGWGVKLSQKNMSDTARTWLVLNANASFLGYLHEALGDSLGSNDASACSVILFGGCGRRLFDPVTPLTIFGGLVTGTPYLYQIPASNRWVTSDSSSRNNASISNTEVVGELGSLGACCLVEGDSVLTLSDSVTGAPAAGAFIEARYGGRIYLNGAPALGDAVATDWQVPGVAAVNKSFFGAVGAALLGTDGSLIVRVS